jgi:diacylglycerol kinase
MKRRFNSFKFAVNGLRIFFRTQPNALIHLFAAVSVILGGFWFEISSQEWLWIILAIGLVFTAEALNTAVEFLVDIVSPEYNPLAGKVKDLAAGAVLMAAITAFSIGVLIFWPYLSAMVTGKL